MLLTTLAAQTSNSAAGGWQMLLPLALVFGAMYFLIIRPQNKRMRAQQNMQSSLKINDIVTTTGGLIGRVVKLEEKEIQVDFNRSGNAVRVLRSAIVGLMPLAQKAKTLTQSNEENAPESQQKQSNPQRNRRYPSSNKPRPGHTGPQQRKPAVKKAEE